MSHEKPIDDEPAPALVRRLATILAADVAGYSRMMGENEEATVQTMRGHRGVFDALLKQHHGRVFNTAGDMILAEFPSAVEAVRCATEIQAALRTRNEHLPPERRMLFRMGINLGDVVVQDGDLLGDGVNVAARIQTVAEPGGICISSSVYDQIQNKLSLQFKSLGDRSFKNIGQPIRTFSVLSGDGTGALPSAPALTARTARIGAMVALLAVAIGAGGYWLYGQNEAKRAEQVALAAQLEAQKQATEEAKRALEAQSLQAVELARRADEARGAAEAAQREAALKAQLQATDEARRRADAERKRLDDELQKSRVERSAGASRAESACGKGGARDPSAKPRAASRRRRADPGQSAEIGSIRRKLRRRDVQPAEQFEEAGVLAGDIDAPEWCRRRVMDPTSAAETCADPRNRRRRRHRQRFARRLVLRGQDCHGGRDARDPRRQSHRPVGPMVERDGGRRSLDEKAVSPPDPQRA